MTPMIDIVFLLIIFFLVSSHLAKQESQLPLPLPTADSGQELGEKSTARVTVNVLSGGEIQLAGKSLLTVDALRERLEYEYQRQQSQLQVHIRSDRDVPYQHIEPILMTCAQIGIWNVQIAVIRSEQTRR